MIMISKRCGNGLIFFLIFSYSVSFYASRPTYSQHDFRGVPLDHLLIDMMNIKNGTFIEVGAYDGLLFSNTKLMEECYGWTGVMIEPSEEQFVKLVANRPNSKCFQCALGAFQEDGTYGEGDFDGGLMSSLNGRSGRPIKVQVLIRSLQSILDECGLNHVNFFSLDTEGYELNILRGIDFDKTTFDYMLIEIYTHQYDDIVRFLDCKGYELVSCLTNYNYVANPGWDGTHNDYLFKRKGLSI